MAKSKSSTKSGQAKKVEKEVAPTTAVEGWRTKARRGFRALFKSRAGSRAWRVIVLCSSSWMILMSFVLSEWLKTDNYLEISQQNIVFITLLNIATALFVVGLIFLARHPKSYMGKLVAVIIMSLFLVNYDTRLGSVSGIFKALIPILPDSSTGGDVAIISALFLAIIVTISIFIGRKVEQIVLRHPHIGHSNVVLGMLVLVGFIFMSQAAKAVSVVSSIIREYNVVVPDTLGGSGAGKVRPDIYYIVLDRYANNETMRRELSFDNSDFIGALEQKGFYVNNSAYSNYPFTSLSVASTMSADYTNEVSAPFKNEEVQSRNLYHKMVQQSQVVKSLKRAGYQYHTVGSIYGSSNKAPLADQEHMNELTLTVFGKRKVLRGLGQTAFSQSVFGQFSKVSNVPGWPLKLTQAGGGGRASYLIDQFRELHDLTDGGSERGGRFIFAHLLLPHPPYLFNSDGSFSDYSLEDNVGKTNNEKYLDQIQFANHQMELLIDSIKEKSKGRAVIVVNADEGPYPTTLNTTIFDGSAAQRYDQYVRNTDMRTWTDDWLRTKYGILQAVHIPLATESDLRHLSSVNVFRIVLNRYADTELPYLPQCNIALSEGDSYQYRQTDITERLTGATSVYCKKIAQ